MQINTKIISTNKNLLSLHFLEAVAAVNVSLVKLLTPTNKTNNHQTQKPTLETISIEDVVAL